MKTIKQIFFSGLIVLILSSPSSLFALGEIDGFWIGLQEISFSGHHVNETTGGVIFQENESSLYFFDDYFGSVRLIKSGNQWILPQPLETTVWGVRIVIQSVVFTFTTNSAMTGRINFTGQGIPGTSTLSHSKRSCQSLSNGATLYNLSGGEDSLQCFQIDLSPGAQNLNIQTSQGSGDCDLYLIYHRPDFDYHVSEEDFTKEHITIPWPNSGRWYLILYGFESYQGVNMTAAYDEIAKPEANFSAHPSSGQLPLAVNFTDQSTGEITGWLWNFGDGTTSTLQNPSHSYYDPGTYTISLTVTGPTGSNTESKTDFIRVWSEQMRLDVEAFIARFYRLCLGRNPDRAGLEGWAIALLDGSLTGSDVAHGFVFSQEFLNKNTTNEEYLQVLYEAFFNRQQDSAGWNGWLNALQHGASRKDVLNGFIYALEFAELCEAYGILAYEGYITKAQREAVEDFVTRFYQLCLDRNPDPAGLEGWANNLLNKIQTGADVANGFIFSPEFIKKGTSNPEYLTILYKAFFNRVPDPAGWNVWISELNGGRDRGEVLNGFIYSQEFAELCKLFGIKAFD